MKIKNILFLFFFLAQYNCYAVDNELNYYTDRVAQLLSEGKNVKINQLQNICEEIKILKNHREDIKKNNPINKETLDNYKKLLMNILNDNHNDSINLFINEIDELQYKYNSEIISDTFFLVVDKLP